MTCLMTSLMISLMPSLMLKAEWQGCARGCSGLQRTQLSRESCMSVCRPNSQEQLFALGSLVVVADLQTWGGP